MSKDAQKAGRYDNDGYDCTAPQLTMPVDIIDHLFACIATSNKTL
jgi:L-asparaginase II